MDYLNALGFNYPVDEVLKYEQNLLATCQM